MPAQKVDFIPCHRASRESDRASDELAGDLAIRAGDRSSRELAGIRDRLAACSPIRATRARSLWLASLAATLTAAACAKSAPAAAAPSWPAGTVLAVDGVPISAEEVDRVGSAFASVEPNDSVSQLRRLALTNVIFPRIAAANANSKRRAEALALAESYRAALVDGTLPSGPLAGPMEVERTGKLLDIGLEVWSFALDAEIDRWSPVLETAGSFEVARVKKRTPGPSPGWTRFTVGLYDFPYVDDDRRKAIDEAIDRSRLVIVDESWREVVPTAWIYRMRGGAP
jgi:hypothetical protein